MKKMIVIFCIISSIVVTLSFWYLYKNENKDEIVSYEECQKRGGAINNMTNDCVLHNTTLHTPYSR